MAQDSLTEIFDKFLTKSTILKNREALRPDYVPDHLPHREDQIQRLGWMLAPTLRRSRCSNIFIYGKPGTGKTAVTRFVLKHLINKSLKLDGGVHIAYINCRTAGTDYRVCSALAEAVRVQVPFTGLATAEVFDRFKSGLKGVGGVLIGILDEVDVLVKYQGDNLLYKLTRINEGSTVGKVVLVGISNDLNFKDLLDPRVLSSLSEEELVFRPYTADELYDILVERAKLSFAEGLCDEGALRLASALAAAEHGDARRALDLLRVAAELAEREDSSRVTDTHVRMAQRKIDEDRITEVLKTLPIHLKLVLCAISVAQDTGLANCLTGDVFEIYGDMCAFLASEPLTQRRVSGLINELDALGVVNARVVSLGRRGRSKRVRLSISSAFIHKLLQGDPRLSALIGYKPKRLHKVT